MPLQDNYAGEYCRVHIRVKCETSIGQEVGICGSTYSIGNLDKSRCVRLVTTPESYPVWSSSEPIIMPVGHIIYYKYCILENGDFHAFENRDGNDRTITPKDTDNFIEDVFSINSIEVLNEVEIEFETQSETKVDLTQIINDARLIIVCYHLPVLIKRSNPPNSSAPFSVIWAESLIAKSKDSSVSTIFQTYWMGTISVPGEEPTEDELNFLVKTLQSMNCIPIFLDKELAYNAYQGFCKLIMWPIFHNVDQLDQIHAAWKLDPLDDSSTRNSTGNDESKAEGGAGTESTTHDVLDWNTDIEVYHTAYAAVNEIFAKELESWCRIGDTLWVHDYHLMLLPKLVRDLNRNIHTVFFLHIPFPTSQIFRSLPAATELLQAMASADVVGFHTFDHARHFLNAMKRMLGIRSHTKQGGILALNVQDREVIVTVSHVSVEVDDIQRVIDNPDTWKNAQDIKNKFHGRKIIVGLDVCQRLSGGIFKLAAFEKFLSDYPKEVNNVVLYQKMIRSASREGDEKTTSADMMKMVDRINNTYQIKSFTGEVLPVVYYEEIPLRSASLADRVALWLASDVFLLTPIKEGLNLYPLEYIYTREKGGCVSLYNAASSHPSGSVNGGSLATGAVLVSEFSTCYSLLNGAMKVNPYYTLSVADTLHHAIYMTAKEAHQRRQRDMSFITSHPSSKWTKEILSDLRHLNNSAFKYNKYNSNNILNSSYSTLNGLNSMNMGIAGVANHHPIPLSFEKVYNSYCNAINFKSCGVSDVLTRVFIFDYGGTLLNKEKSDIYIKQSLSAISGRSPSNRMMSAIRQLASDPRNCILIVTGLTKLKLGEIFGDMKNVSIGTSNGLVYSWGDSLLMANEADEVRCNNINKVMNIIDNNASATAINPTTPRSLFASNTSNNSLLKLTMKDINDNKFGRIWESLGFDVNWEAVRDIAIPIITKFTFRTNGTCQTPRIPGIGWSYFGADPEWGLRQATQCKLELEAALAKLDVKVVSQIQGSIEVVPSELNKGVLVKLFLERIQHKRSGLLPSFTLLVGDDESDDYMTRVFYSTLANSATGAGLARSKSYTVTVGRRDCPSHYYVNEVKDVEDLLVGIASLSGVTI